MLRLTTRIGFRSPARCLATQSLRGFSTVKPLGPDDVDRAQALDASLRNNYTSVKDYGNDSLTDEAYRKKLIYRAKQRGWLEVDLLMGSWATEFVPKLSKEELKEFDEVLQAETLDMFRYLTGQDDVPEKLKNNKLIRKIREYAEQSPVGQASPEGYAKIKSSMSN